MATINSTLKFQDQMSSRMESIARQLEITSAEAKIAKSELDQLENAQKQWKITLDALNNAQIKDKNAIAKAREEYLKALKAYDDGVLKVSKYEQKLNELEKQQNKNVQGFESMAGKVVTLSAAFQLFNQVKGIITGINTKINEYIQYSRVQAQAENQLAIITKQRLGLEDKEIKSLYALASAQQKVGIVGDEAVITGMAGVAAFTKEKSSIEALTPAMNNLAVKMYGYNVTAESMDMISKSLGKALMGDVGALSRMGVKIDDVTKKRLMSLKEEQRAIELAKIIKNVTGDMNEEMAKTPYGQIAQAQNRLGDSYEKLGNSLLPLQATFIEVWSNIIGFITDKIDTIVPLLVTAIGTVTVAMTALKIEAFLASEASVTAALSMIKAWAAAAAPILIIIGIIGAVSLAMKALGVDFREQAQNILISINWIVTACKNLISHIENIGIAIHNAFSKDKWDYKKIEANDLYTNTEKANRQMQKIGGKTQSMNKLLGTTNANASMGLDKYSDGTALKTKQQGDISIKEDDIEMLHDLATKDYAQYFQQLTPNLTIPNMVIHETADVNQVIGAVANAITGAISSSTDGGYAIA